ncbi:MAG: purine-nucleoside phosphorylase [Clostridia bacterium]|nr:purine-nucleoside phosphorylase [Clostridia bacterium]
MNVPTPHINAKFGDFAKTVLMPGDPKRSAYIAGHFLSDAVLVNDVRGVQGYTGTYKGKRVSVMASGMGIPSIGIYSYELFKFFDVDNIIRVGSAGAISPQLELRDIVIGQSACTDSNYMSQYGLRGNYSPIACYQLLERAVNIAKERNYPYVVGSLYSSDCFYDASAGTMKWGNMGVLAVEMEAAGLYATANFLGKNALAICTISDSLVTGQSLDSDARQNTFTQMMELALEIA